MKLTFESNLQYQQDAIKSITGLFEGQTPPLLQIRASGGIILKMGRFKWMLFIAPLTRT